MNKEIEIDLEKITKNIYSDRELFKEKIKANKNIIDAAINDAKDVLIVVSDSQVTGLGSNQMLSYGAVLMFFFLKDMGLEKDELKGIIDIINEEVIESDE